MFLIRIAGSQRSFLEGRTLTILSFMQNLQSVEDFFPYYSGYYAKKRAWADWEKFKMAQSKSCMPTKIQQKVFYDNWYYALYSFSSSSLEQETGMHLSAPLPLTVLRPLAQNPQGFLAPTIFSFGYGFVLASKKENEIDCPYVISIDTGQKIWIWPIARAHCI